MNKLQRRNEMGIEEIMIRITTTDGFDICCYDCGMVEIKFEKHLLQIPREQFDKLVSKRGLLMM